MTKLKVFFFIFLKSTFNSNKYIELNHYNRVTNTFYYYHTYSLQWLEKRIENFNKLNDNHKVNFLSLVLFFKQFQN